VEYGIQWETARRPAYGILHDANRHAETPLSASRQALAGP
jgi:hypothetical protein